MKEKLLTILFYFFLVTLCAQSSEHAWVYLKDKPSENVFLSEPVSMLSQRALDRRIRYNIDLDSYDVPVELSYINQINNATGIQVMAKSKWLNALHVVGSVDNIRNLIDYDFVEKIDFADSTFNGTSKPSNVILTQYNSDKLEVKGAYNYGVAENQILQLKGNSLHEKDFTGEGMIIAILDAGFPNVDTFPQFSKIRSNGQILGGYNFVERSTNFYSRHYHGMSVLSTIAGYVENEFVGTAPDASFYLFITEDSAKETPLEESLWVEAAERADSLGVDVINTSLGYTTFDNPNYSYSYEDLDGKTTFISRGATKAFSRGMLLLTSAGNEGNDPWHYISAPADAVDVISVGAVDAVGTSAAFSSYGPSSDGRVKPDVSAQGQGVFVVKSDGTLGQSNGTSFSSPILAGVVTCLWQAFPELTNMEIVDLIREAGHLYPSSTPQAGYGIPDFETLFLELLDDNFEGTEPLIYPNPVQNTAYYKLPKGVNEVNVTILNLLGKAVFSSTITRFNNATDLEFLIPGVYMVKMTATDGNQSTTTVKMIKR